MSPTLHNEGEVINYKGKYREKHCKSPEFPLGLRERRG